MIIPLLFQLICPCPYGATSASIGVGVYASTNRPLEYGESRVIRAALINLPDPLFGNVPAAVSGGRVFLVIDGVTEEVTPEEPFLVGDLSCVDPVPARPVVYSRPLTIVGRGQPILVRAEYIDGIAHLNPPLPVSGANIRVFPCNPPNPIRLTNNVVWCRAYLPQYTIEQSEDLRTWTVAGVASASPDGFCRLDVGPMDRGRFFRHSFVP